MNRVAIGACYIISDMVHRIFCDSDERQITFSSLRYLMKANDQAGLKQRLIKQVDVSSEAAITGVAWHVRINGDHIVGVWPVFHRKC